MKITLEQLKAMLPTIKKPEQWLATINIILPENGIDTPERIAAFFAQAGHESQDCNTLSENLNYSWERLRQVFPRYFKTDAIAKEYHRNPEKIANHVYDDANRVNKIGNTKPGDGWLFRGRGIFQLTGRTNYTAFAKSLNITPEAATIYLQSHQGALQSACWFWNQRNLNSYADRQDIVGMSKAVNGGDIGLADRIARYKRNLAVMQDTKAVQDMPRALQRGSKGADVRRVQVALGFSGKAVDGDYGRITEAAVSSWQRSHKMVATGRLTGPQVAMLLT